MYRDLRTSDERFAFVRPGQFVGRRRPLNWLWLIVAAWLAVFVMTCAAITAKGAEPAVVKVVYVGATWCAPCAGAKQFTVPALRKAGAIVEELDFDRDAGKLPASVTDLPVYFVVRDGRVLDTIIGHVHPDVVLRRIKSINPAFLANAATATPSTTPDPKARQPPPTTATPDLVAQLRRFLGTSQPRSHSSLGWQFEAPLEIELDSKTTITRPKQVFAEFDFDKDVLTVTFAEPLPQAHVIKAGATISVDIPRVTIRKNVVTATADLAFGIQKEFEFVILRSPFDE